MAMSSAPGQNPAPSGATPQSDAPPPPTPAEISTMAEEAVTEAINQRRQEGGKCGLS